MKKFAILIKSALMLKTNIYGIVLMLGITFIAVTRLPARMSTIVLMCEKP